jgi:hypothetical protein
MLSTSTDQSQPATEDSKSATWPACGPIGGTCFIYDMGELAGGDVLNVLLRYVCSAEDGSRLTLQKNRDGFSAQVTGAVHRPDKGGVDLQSLIVARRDIDSSNTRQHMA